jgi:hypothetical protein
MWPGRRWLCAGEAESIPPGRFNGASGAHQSAANVCFHTSYRAETLELIRSAADSGRRGTFCQEIMRRLRPNLGAKPVVVRLQPRFRQKRRPSKQLRRLSVRMSIEGAAMEDICTMRCATPAPSFLHYQIGRLTLNSPCPQALPQRHDGMSALPLHQFPDR